LPDGAGSAISESGALPETTAYDAAACNGSMHLGGP
jgi:hypothetical protein